MRRRPPFRNPLVGLCFSCLLLWCQHAYGGPFTVPSARAQKSSSQLLATMSWAAVGTLLIHLNPVKGIMKTSYASLLLQENVSIAKVKFPLLPAVYGRAFTYDTLRTFEKYGVLTLTPDKIAVMYNWCQEQDTYANDISSNLYLACKVRIEFFSMSGERLQQEFFDTEGTLRVQSMFTFFDPETYPEMKAIGFWVHGPHEGVHSNKIVLALWTAKCPDPDAARECVADKREGCFIHLKKRVKEHAAGDSAATSKDTCMSSLFDNPILSVRAGLRLCDAGEKSMPWPYQSSSDCFYYDLPATDATGRGWKKPADGKLDGYRLGSTKTVSKDGGRYGSVYLVRFSAGGSTIEWTRKISSHAFLDYGEGIENAVHAGEAVTSSGVGGVTSTEMQYSVTYHSHYWKPSVEGPALLKRLCYVQVVRGNGELVDAGGGGLVNTKCTNCSSQPMSRVHHQSHQWMSVCSNSSGDAPGIYLNDQLVVDSLESLKPLGVTSLDPDLIFAVDTHPQIIPTGANEWLLFWKALSTLPGPSVGSFGPHVQEAKLMLAKYDAATKTLSASPTVVVGGLSEPEYGAPRISRFGPNTLLVGFYSSLRHTTTLLEITEDGRNVTANAMHVDRTLVGVLLNSASATEWQHHTDNTVYWLDRAAHTEGLDQYEMLRPAVGFPGFSLHLLKIQGHTTDADCRVQWESSAPCDQSCHTEHLLREISPGTNCPVPVGSLRVTPCSDHLCEPINVAKVVEVTLDDPSRSISVMDRETESATSGKSEAKSSAERWSASFTGRAGPASEDSPAATSTSLFMETSPMQSQKVARLDTKAAPTASLPTGLNTKSDISATSTTEPRPVSSGRTEPRTSSGASPLFDRDVTTAIEFNKSKPSSFAVYLSGGGDIHEFSAVFLLETFQWEEGLRLSCAAYDRFGKALLVREGFIGRLPLRNFLKPAGVNVSLWQWTNIRLFGVQAVQCTSGSPSLLPSSSLPFSTRYSPHPSSTPSASSSPASFSVFPPRSLQGLGFSNPRTADFQPASPAAPEKAAATNTGTTGFISSVLSDFPSLPPPSEPPSLRVAELIVLGRPNGGGACPPEGFFSHVHCASEASRPVFDLATLDCKGEWSEWTLCDENCMSSRVFRKQKEASWGGRPCQRIQKKPCGDGPYCTSSSFTSVLPNGKSLLPRQRPCSYTTGPWSDCLHCRQLRFHNILAEAAGPNVEACPDPIEMRYCNQTCRLQYDFAYTATSTYPPATTQRNPLPTFVPPPRVRHPLSWRRWYTMGRYTIAGFCLLGVLLLIFLAGCVYCSFRGNVQQQQQQQQLEGQADAGSSADEPALPHSRVTLAGMRRQTAAAVHTAIASVIEFAEEPRTRTQVGAEGKPWSPATAGNVDANALPCEEMLTMGASGASQGQQNNEKSGVRCEGIFTGPAESSDPSTDGKLNATETAVGASEVVNGCSTIAKRRFRTTVRSKLFSKGFARFGSLHSRRGEGEFRRSRVAARSQTSENTSDGASNDSFLAVSFAEETEGASSADEWEDVDTNSPVRCLTNTESDQVRSGYPYNRSVQECVSVDDERRCQPSKKNTSFALSLRHTPHTNPRSATNSMKERHVAWRGVVSWRRRDLLNRVRDGTQVP